MSFDFLLLMYFAFLLLLKTLPLMEFPVFAYCASGLILGEGYYCSSQLVSPY